MARSIKKTLEKEYQQLKKAMKKIWMPREKREWPPLALQPVRRQPDAGNEKNTGNDFR